MRSGQLKLMQVFFGFISFLLEGMFCYRMEMIMVVLVGYRIQIKSFLLGGENQFNTLCGWKFCVGILLGVG